AKIYPLMTLGETAAHFAARSRNESLEVFSQVTRSEALRADIRNLLEVGILGGQEGATIGNQLNDKLLLARCLRMCVTGHRARWEWERACEASDVLLPLSWQLSEVSPDALEPNLASDLINRGRVLA